MGAVIEVKYFNSFLLKKIPAQSAVQVYGTNNTLLYLGSFGVPSDIGGYSRSYTVQIQKKILVGLLKKLE